MGSHGRSFSSWAEAVLQARWPTQLADSAHKSRPIAAHPKPISHILFSCPRLLSHRSLQHAVRHVHDLCPPCHGARLCAPPCRPPPGPPCSPFPGGQGLGEWGRWLRAAGARLLGPELRNGGAPASTPLWGAAACSRQGCQQLLHQASTSSAGRLAQTADFPVSCCPEPPACWPPHRLQDESIADKAKDVYDSAKQKVR
jgi:hypothetical protein